MGDWTAAAHDCEAFLKVDSCNAPAHYYYALVQYYAGAAAAAEQALKRAIYLDGNFALAHYQLGLLRKDAQDQALCSRSFQNVLGALRDVPDEVPVSPCGAITALDLRELASRQLELLGRLRAGQP
jgi:chemotaxis protein methyltransferase CheR